MHIGVITLFPQIFDALHYGIIGRALKRQLLMLSLWNPREYASDAHHTVDDRPYGGGPGMVMKFEPLQAALKAAKTQLGKDTPIIHLTPQGRCLTQSVLAQKVHTSPLILLTGRYEGIDERLIELEVDEELSVGDYIVSGGEFPALIFIDAITRLLSGALGHPESSYQESFVSGLLDYPHYTRPSIIFGHSVPEVLRNGNHAAIDRWRLKQSLGRTWQRRKDLIQRRTLSENEQRLLDEFIQEST